MTKRKKWVPRDTGNLAYNGITISVEGDFLIIEANPNIVPYIPYTNEPWISPKWKGKKNPNEGWWDRFATEFARRLAKRLKGEIKND